MIIEFVGYPSSGKSSIINHLDSKYEVVTENGNWLLRNIYKFYKCISYSLLNLKKCWNVISLIHRSRQKRKCDFFRLALNNIYLLSFYNKKDENKNIIVDEGIVQHLWAIMIGSTNEFNIENYLSLFQGEIVVVYIKISSDKFVERFYSRDVKNGKKYKVNKRHFFLFNEIKNNFMFLDELYEKLPYKYKYIVNNDYSIEKSIDQVNKNIGEIINEN